MLDSLNSENINPRPGGDVGGNAEPPGVGHRTTGWKKKDHNREVRQEGVQEEEEVRKEELTFRKLADMPQSPSHSCSVSGKRETKTCFVISPIKLGLF